MTLLATLLTLLVSVEHFGFLVLEMFLWRGPVGRKVFRTTREQAETTATLAMNQGLYNGFLAAGLLFAIYVGSAPMQLFLLGCVVVAGLFGGATVSPRIVVVQALPAAIALVVRALV